jgi:hypothetical protein
MPYSRRVLAAASVAAVLGAAASAAPANAATLTIPPCVVDYGPPPLKSVPILGQGFNPLGLVNLVYASTANPTPQPLATATADAAGSFQGTTLPLPFKSDTTTKQTFTIAATSAANPALTAFKQFQQVRFGASAKPSSGRAKRKVRYTARGFTPGKAVYMHFRYHGVTRRNVKLAKANSPCGIATRKLSLLPTKVRYGTWKVYIDQVKTYKKTTVLQAAGQITITRVFS